MQGFFKILHAYLNSEHAELMAKLNETGDWKDELESQLRKAIEDFKANGVY